MKKGEKTPMRTYQKLLLLLADAVAVLRCGIHILQIIAFGGLKSHLYAAPYFHAGGFWDYEPFWGFTFWSALLLFLAVLALHFTAKAGLPKRFYGFGYLWCVAPALWMLLTELCFILSDAPYPGLVVATLGCCCNILVTALFLRESSRAMLPKTA